ncbi:uncharacterized protein [Littorina saxatilis]|uniref:uncharacterized protein n=1 Tax=Littorina saxatilis TaxID=31220 RepID=UPI0038B5A8CE
MASNASDNAEDETMSNDADDGFEEAAKYIWVVGGSILIVIGTVGNLLALAVLTRPKLRRSNAAVYLMVVAVTDLAVLYTGLLRQIIISSTKRDIREDSEFSCKLHTSLVYFFLDFSAWLLAALSLERLFSVRWPHKVRQKCTRMTSICVITGIGVTLFAINAHFLGTMGDMTIDTPNGVFTVKCAPLSEDFYHVVTSVWSWVDLGVFALLPLTIHIVCNIFIVRRVVSSFNESRRNRGFDPPTTSRSHTGAGCPTTARLDHSVEKSERSWISQDSPSNRRAHKAVDIPDAGQSREGLGSAEGSQSPARGGLDISQGSEHHPSLGTTSVSVLTGPTAIRSGHPDLAASHMYTTNTNAEARTHSPVSRRRKPDHHLHITPHASGGHQRVSAIQSPASPRDDKRVSSMTLMLVTVSSVFCLTTLPISIYYITNWILVQHGYHAPYRKVAWPVLNLLMYTNNSVNFFLYSLSGSRFRTELKTLWHLLCKRLPRPVRFRRSSGMMSSSMTSSRSGKSKSSVEIRRWSSNTEMSTMESHEGKKKTTVPATAHVKL